MRYNLIYTLVLSLLFIVLEIYFRTGYEVLENIPNISNFLEIFVLFFILSFIPKKISNIFLVFLSVMFVIEILHFNYFGYFIFPMEFILLFTKFHEILETGITILNILIIPILYSLIIFGMVFFVNKVTKNRLIVNNSKYILIVFIIIPIINTGIHYKKRGLGDRPNSNKSIIKNELYVTKAFLGKTLPLTFLNIQTVPDYKNDKFQKKINNNINNVIFIIGESLSFHNMSLYGYKINTTPNLLKLKSEKNFIALKAISGGVFTDTSIPMLINVEKKPNAINHILTNETNLFKLAKDNGYNTYFISAQANDGFSYIRSYMGIKYIDNYIDSLNYGYDKYTSGLDDILVNELKKIDLSKKNFIVLNMIGSHSPYKTRVPKDFQPFGIKNVLSYYNNTVSYSDKILSSIIEFIKDSNKKILFVFTSDHGQSVSKNGYGHGNIKNPFHYQVPAIIYSNNFAININFLDKLKSTRFTSHYNLALFVSYYLGYNTLKYIDDNKSYINGNELSGNGGYIEYNLKTNIYSIK